MRDALVDVILPQEPPEFSKLLILVIHHHLVVHHARREHGDKCTAKDQANGQAENVEDALTGVHASDLYGAQRELRHTPVESRDVLVHETGLLEGHLPAIVFCDSVRPPPPRVRCAQFPNRKPRASDDVVDPERGAHHGHAPHRNAVPVRQVLLQKLFGKVCALHHPQQPYDPHKLPQLGKAQNPDAQRGAIGALISYHGKNEAHPIRHQQHKVRDEPGL
mmetsp:Transcript_28824/g.67143  ORF Transcript_28824/g.67143 Transcript_28824/m.67143 type:complete len:220 (-) Transcript_28824:813-1472(-)